MNDEKKATLDWYCKYATKPVAEYRVAACCGSSLFLLEAPIGICFDVGTPEQLEEYNQSLSGFKTFNDSLDIGDGKHLLIRGVCNDPNNLDARRKPSGEEYLLGSKFRDSGTFPPHVVHATYDSYFGHFNLDRLVNHNREYGETLKKFNFTNEEKFGALAESLKGKFVITIEVDDYTTIYANIIEALKPYVAYRSPWFQNRRYNKGTDYLQCVIYKF